MKQIWLIIEWQLPDGTGRVICVVDGTHEDALKAADGACKPYGGAISISQANYNIK